MRWVALAIVLVAARGADARVVMRPRDPIVVQACRARPNWRDVERCLDKLGTFTIERSLDRARLVHVWIDDPDLREEDPKQDMGVYLFVQKSDSTWVIGGMFAQGMSDTVLSLAAVTIERHLGYRIDVGTLQRTGVALEGAPPVQTVIRMRTSVYCYGNNHRCIQVMTVCEVLSRGKTLLAFHGTARVEGGDIVVDGDPSLGGSVCVGTQRFPLGWAEDDG